MQGKFAVKVMGGRVGTGGAKLFFSVALGTSDEQGNFLGTATLRDCVLREGSKGDFVSFPSKPRVKKVPVNGQVGPNNPQLYAQMYDAEGKAQYDNLFDLYFEKAAGAEKGSPTDSAWAFRKEVLEQAQSLYVRLSSGNAGRGAAAPAGVATSVGGRAAPDIFGDTDEAPF